MLKRAQAGNSAVGRLQGLAPCRMVPKSARRIASARAPMWKDRSARNIRLIERRVRQVARYRIAVVQKRTDVEQARESPQSRVVTGCGRREAQTAHRSPTAGIMHREMEGSGRCQLSASVAYLYASP